MSYELHKKAIYVVDRDNDAAWSVMRKIADTCKPGAVIPVTAAEFEALRDGVIVLIPPPPEAPSREEPPSPPAEKCESTNPSGWRCSREKGHEGIHITIGSLPTRAWDDEGNAL